MDVPVPEHVFVYGSLKKGGFLNYYMPDVDPVRGEFVGGIIHNTGSWPALEMVEDESKIIVGEIYPSNDDLLKKLDRVEGVPDLFRRAKFLIRVEKGHVYCWVYIAADPVLLKYPIVESGEWVV